MKTVTCIIKTVLLLFFTTISCMASDVRLAWDPNSETDLAGYILYISENGSDYFRLAVLPLEEIDPSRPEYLVTDLEDGAEYCFVATAYSKYMESDYSNEVCAIDGEESVNPDEAGDDGGTDGQGPDTCCGSEDTLESGGGGPGSGGCFINSLF